MGGLLRYTGGVISFTLYTKPLPVNRRTMIHQGRQTSSRQWKDTKEELAWEVRSHWYGPPLKGDRIVYFQLYFGDRKRRDIDAYLKILLDAMEGIVYEDDAQVVEMHVYKHVDRDEPRTVVQVL